MSRPDILFPLFADLTALDGIGPKTARIFARLDITRPVDLILTLPTGGVDRRLRPSIRDARLPDIVTVEVEVGLHQPPAGRGRPYRVHVRDARTEFQLVFFHAREDWLRRGFPPASAASSPAGSSSSTASPRWSTPTTSSAPARPTPCPPSSRSTR